MKKCAQCGSEYPMSNESCPKCGYGANGFSNNPNDPNNKSNNVLKIVVIVIAVIVVITAISIIAFSKLMFNNIVDMESNMDNGFSASSAEECSDKCDGSYMYVNGTCSCMSIDFE